MFRKTLISTVILASSATMAEKVPTPGQVDSRIKTVIYDQRNVVRINGHYGYSTHVVFGSSETIEDIVAGDSLGWQIIPGVSPNHLTFKPTEELNHTNVTIVTNKHTYNFELDAHDNHSRKAKDLTFDLYFRYPQEELAQTRNLLKQKERLESSVIIKGENFDVNNINWQYTRNGSEELAPIRVFDDGKFTFFQFDETKQVPAIFIVKEDKSESLANYHKDGNYYVVERIAGQFALRDTGVVTCIYNDNWETKVESEVPEQSKSEHLAGVSDGRG